MHHKYLLYLLLLNSLSVNAMDDQKDDNKMNIYEAAFFGNKKRMKELLGSGTSVDEKSEEDGYATLYVQSWGYGKISFNKDLSFDSFSPPCVGAKQTKIYKKGDAPLLIAVNERQKSIVQLLLERNASVNTKDIYETSPLFYAILHWKPESQKHIGLVETLLACGSDTDQKRFDFPLHLAVRTSLHYRNHPHFPEYLYIVKILLKYNAPVNIKNGDGETALGYLLKIEGIKEFYLDNEKSLKKTEKKRKVKRRKITNNAN